MDDDDDDDCAMAGGEERALLFWLCDSAPLVLALVFSQVVTYFRRRVKG